MLTGEREIVLLAILEKILQELQRIAEAQERIADAHDILTKPVRARFRD